MDAGDGAVLSVVMAYATQIGQQRFNDASTRGRVKKLCEMIATILAIDTTARSNPVWFEVALLLDLPDSEIQSCLPEHLRYKEAAATTEQQNAPEAAQAGSATREQRFMTAQELESATARALELLQDYCRIIKNDKMLYSAASAALGMGSALPDTPVGNAKLVQFVERALWLLRHGSNMGHAMMAIFATDIYHRLVRVTRRGPPSSEDNDDGSFGRRPVYRDDPARTVAEHLRRLSNELRQQEGAQAAIDEADERAESAAQAGPSAPSQPAAPQWDLTPRGMTAEDWIMVVECILEITVDPNEVLRILEEHVFYELTQGEQPPPPYSNQYVPVFNMLMLASGRGNEAILRRMCEAFFNTSNVNPRTRQAVAEPIFDWSTHPPEVQRGYISAFLDGLLRHLSFFEERDSEFQEVNGPALSPDQHLAMLNRLFGSGWTILPDGEDYIVQAIVKGLDWPTDEETEPESAPLKYHNELAAWALYNDPVTNHNFDAEVRRDIVIAYLQGVHEGSTDFDASSARWATLFQLITSAEMDTVIETLIEEGRWYLTTLIRCLALAPDGSQPGPDGQTAPYSLLYLSLKLADEDTPIGGRTPIATIAEQLAAWRAAGFTPTPTSAKSGLRNLLLEIVQMLESNAQERVPYEMPSPSQYARLIAAFGYPQGPLRPLLGYPSAQGPEAQRSKTYALDPDTDEGALTPTRALIERFKSIPPHTMPRNYYDYSSLFDPEAFQGLQYFDDDSMDRMVD